MSDSAEYRTAFLTALAVVMAAAPFPTSSPPEEPFLLECLHLLLTDLEEQKGGPEFLSQALNVASLLLSQWPDSRFLYVLS